MDSTGLLENNRLVHALTAAKQMKRTGPHKFDYRGRGFVYVVECRGYVKFGVSNNAKRRLNLLQTGCPFQLTLLASFERKRPYKTEERLHLKLHRYHVRGEWFDVPTEVMGAVIKELEGCSI